MWRHRDKIRFSLPGLMPLVGSVGCSGVAGMTFGISLLVRHFLISATVQSLRDYITLLSYR